MIGGENDRVNKPNILKMKKEDPNDRGSNDRVKKLEYRCAKKKYKNMIT